MSAPPQLTQHADLPDRNIENDILSERLKQPPDRESGRERTVAGTGLRGTEPPESAGASASKPDAPAAQEGDEDSDEVPSIVPAPPIPEAPAAKTKAAKAQSREKRPKAAAKKSAAMPPSLRRAQGSVERACDNDWDAGDGDLQMGLQAALGQSEDRDEVITVDDAEPPLKAKSLQLVGWLVGTRLPMVPLDLPKDLCWQPSKLKSKQLHCRQVQRTPGPGVVDVEGETAALQRDPVENGAEVTGQVRRGLRLAGEWRPPPLLQLPSEVRPWDAAAYRGTELSVRASSRAPPTAARQEEVGPEYRIKLVGLLRDLESRSSGLSEPALLRTFWSRLSNGERNQFAHEFPQFLGSF